MGKEEGKKNKKARKKSSCMILEAKLFSLKGLLT